jgi:hypothetical protein
MGMILPTPGPVRQAFAQGVGGPAIAFAMQLLLGDPCSAGRNRLSFSSQKPRTYPSPSLRSGPSQAGPTPFRISVISVSGWLRYRLEIRDFSVESGTITTTQRGSTTCGSRLSSSLFSPRPWPAACRIRLRAGLPARPQARLSPMRWTKTCSQAQHLAALQVLPPAGSSWACRPATPATELTACGRSKTPRKAIRADRPGGLCISAPEGEPRCSRRS